MLTPYKLPGRTRQHLYRMPTQNQHPQIFPFGSEFQSKLNQKSCSVVMKDLLSCIKNGILTYIFYSMYVCFVCKYVLLYVNRVIFSFNISKISTCGLSVCWVVETFKIHCVVWLREWGVCHRMNCEPSREYTCCLWPIKIQRASRVTHLWKISIHWTGIALLHSKDFYHLPTILKILCGFCWLTREKLSLTFSLSWKSDLVVKWFLSDYPGSFRGLALCWRC